MLRKNRTMKMRTISIKGNDASWNLNTYEPVSDEIKSSNVVNSDFAELDNL